MYKDAGGLALPLGVGRPHQPRRGVRWQLPVNQRRAGQNRVAVRQRYRPLASVQSATQAIVTAGEDQRALWCAQPLDPASGELRTRTADFERALKERQGRVGVIELLLDGQGRPL